MFSASVIGPKGRRQFVNGRTPIDALHCLDLFRRFPRDATQLVGYEASCPGLAVSIREERDEAWEALSRKLARGYLTGYEH